MSIIVGTLYLNSADDELVLDIFLFFPRKKDITFHANKLVIFFCHFSRKLDFSFHAN